MSVFFVHVHKCNVENWHYPHETAIVDKNIQIVDKLRWYQTEEILFNLHSEKPTLLKNLCTQFMHLVHAVKQLLGYVF